MTPPQPEQQWTYKREPAGMGEWCYGFYRGDTRFFYTETESQARVILPLLNCPTPASHKTNVFFEPLLNCDCEVCKDAREAHDAAVAAQARENVLEPALLYDLIYWAILFRDKNCRLPTGVEARNHIEESLRGARR